MLPFFLLNENEMKITERNETNYLQCQECKEDDIKLLKKRAYLLIDSYIEPKNNYFFGKRALTDPYCPKGNTGLGAKVLR